MLVLSQPRRSPSDGANSQHSAPPEQEAEPNHSIASEQDEHSLPPAHPEHTPIDITQNAPIQLLPTLMVPPNFNEDDRLGQGTYGTVDVITAGGVTMARKSFLAGGFNTELNVYETLQSNNEFCPFLIRMLVYHFDICVLFTKHF